MVRRNFVKTIEESLKENWNRECFSNYQETAFKYGDIAESILTFHEAFRRSGIKKGDKIAVCGKNSVNWAKLYLSAVSYGAVIVPILPEFPAVDILNIINHSDSKIFFASEALWQQLDFEAMPELEVGGSLETLRILHSSDRITNKVIEEAAAAVKSRYPSITPEDISFEFIENSELASIVYTSGTTGFSKGVMISHNALMANVDYAQRSINLQAGDSIVSFLPIAHSFGCAFEFLFPFCTGCHITFLNKRVSPQLILSSFGEIKPRLILSVPLVIEKVYFKQIKPILNKPIAKIPVLKQILYKIIRKKLDKTFGGNFITIVIGAAAFNPEVEAFLKKIRFRFTVGYGMTECAPLISYMPWDKYKGRSSGQIIDFLECRIDSEDQANIQGEILVRGENVMMGYYKNEEATRNAIDEHGWLHTGDMGTLDNENTVYIKGRCKSMLLGAGGQNIYPEELEARLNNHDLIAESLVLERDSHITALVYPDTDYLSRHGISAAAISEHLEEIRKKINREIPSYSSIVKMVVQESEFEKTPTAKIKRYKYA